MEAIRGHDAKAGGELIKSVGVCLPVDILDDVAEQVIVL